jgi:tetratricopeptide (TPR) repeat protein
MMKNITSILFIALMGLFALNGMAQKVDREPVGYYSYTQFPLETSLVNFKTYKVVSKDAMDAYKTDKMVAAINLIGFEEKEAGQDADFTVEIQEYPIKIGDSERKTRVETYKQDGVEKKRTYYYYSAKATFKYKVRVFANLDEIIYSDEVSGNETVTGGEDQNSSKAYDSFKSKRSTYMADLISEKAGVISSRINERYCFPIKKERIESAFIKAKKFNYDDYTGFFESMKEGYGIVSNDENAITEAMPSFDKAIEGFKKMLTESDPENRKARINKSVTALLYANIGNCYFMLKEYDKAQDAFNMGGEFKNNIGDMRHMKNLSEDLQKRKVANAK